MKETVNSYRDLKVWRKSMDLVVACYRLTKLFPNQEKYGLVSQLQRAAVSVPSNIAEGHGRKYTNDYLRFLSIANGSLMEVETQIQIAQRLNFINSEECTTILNQTSEISRMLRGLKAALKRNIVKETDAKYDVYLASLSPQSSLLNP